MFFFCPLRDNRLHKTQDIYIYIIFQLAIRFPVTEGSCAELSFGSCLYHPPADPSTLPSLLLDRPPVRGRQVQSIRNNAGQFFPACEIPPQEKIARKRVSRGEISRGKIARKNAVSWLCSVSHPSLHSAVGVAVVGLTDSVRETIG